MDDRLTKSVVAVLASALLLTGCNTKEEPKPLIDDLPALDDISVLGDLPEGTVQTGPTTYMVPLESLDADGCQGYRVHSPGRLTVQAIYYRMASGEFTVNKLQAACRQRDADKESGAEPKDDQ